MPLFAALVVIGGLLASIAIWAPRSLRLRAAAVIALGLLAGASYGGLLDLLGRPKPAALVLTPFSPADATVVSAHLREPEAIYVWLLFDEQQVPRAYSMPWDLETARELTEGMQDAEARGTTVRMRAGMRRDRDPDEPLFYVAPQDALPPKMEARRNR